MSSNYIYDTQLDAFELWHKEQEQKYSSSILGGPALPALGHAISGSLGSAVSNVITYPLSLVITRLQVQRQFRSSRGNNDEYKSIADAIEQIYAKEGGIPAFYSGCLQDTAKTMVDSFLFFLAYSFIRQRRLGSQTSGSKRLPVQEEIAVGMVAGAFAKLFTTPIANIVTRKQTATMVAAREGRERGSLSVRDIAQQIRDQKGLQGFWSGYSASLVLTLNPALTFLFHETLLRMFVTRVRRADPGARLTFLIAATSKVFASTITYPFSLAKSRAQVSAKSPNAETTAPITEKDSLRDASSKSATKVRRQTVFDTVYQIAQQEGIAGLYQGLGGELLKGYFSHGMTMLIKERIHKIVIRLYYFILDLMQKYPSPEEIAKSAGQQATNLTGAVGEKMTAAGEAASGMAQKAVEAGKDVASSTQKQASDGLGKGQEVVDKGMDTVSHLYQRAKEDATDLVDEYINTGEDDD
ncbi:mitochondrial carrier [Tothia fuscella]|uniref:Mitochondrial carrier n=1 Tax=Tothia fuscella TaxID=1048955 RepID=A0A9P4TZD8_9PEZI|nr:mitochondrial carrier [Tothia fuscella]